MNKYFMGIDNGGTGCKAVIFDSDGAEVAAASESLVMITPGPGQTERDMEELWNVNLRVIKKAVENLGSDVGQIAGIACSGHGKGLYLWGKDGRPCRNGIVSTDSRAVEYSERWKANGIAEAVFKKTFQSVLACQPAALLSWLKDNETESLQNIQWIFEVKDYIRFRLTGKANAEITDYSGSGLLNLETRQFDRELLELYGLGQFYGFLPPLCRSTDFCGNILPEVAEATGLPSDTAVAGGMFDIDACAIAMNISDEKYICQIAGTWSINEYISKNPVLNRSIMMNSIYCMDDYYLIEECSPTSAGNLEWFTGFFLRERRREIDAWGGNIYEYCNSLVDLVEVDEQDIIFLPFIFGSNYNPSARACFIGLDSRHTDAHMIRAVYEGIVFCHMVHLEKLLQNRKGENVIRLAGGAARSVQWSQMFSDVSGLPVEIVDASELGALGCAIAASVAIGEHKTLTEAAERMVRIKSRLRPDMKKHKIYMEKYKLYKEISDLLDPVWK